MTFDCPKCGGKNNLEIAANEFIKCSYCNNFSYIDLDGIVSVYTYKSLININDTTMFLKKDFEKTGFSEEFRLINRYPVYIPFWDVEGSRALEKGSSNFKSDDEVRPSEEKIVFDHDSVTGSVEVVEPDIVPEKAGKKILCYLPFYRVVINYKGEEYDFLVNGMSGEITGDPIPFVSVKEAGALFPQFALIFIVAFVINFLFDNLFLAVFSNIVAVYLLFSFSISKISRKLYKNER
ncbi:MAG: hypothetical protein ABFR36_02700 [Acidobacteriota bacterium]